MLLVQRAENITDFMQQQGQGAAEVERTELWRRRAQEVETDLYARAQELAVAVRAQQLASRRLSSGLLWQKHGRSLLSQTSI